MERFSIIKDDGVTTVVADVQADWVLLDADALAAATGWVVKPEGLCRDEVCVPRALWPDVLEGERIDLADVARMTGQVLALDTVERVAALAPGAQHRTGELASLRAPAFTVSTIDDEAVSLADFRGRKKLLVAFASW
jgi:hypothetical protein